jgi:uncharacterized membrane protein
MNEARERGLLAAVVGLFVVTFTAAAWTHERALYENLDMGARDLLLFSQPLWCARHGAGLATSIGTHGRHAFSEHLHLTQYVNLALSYVWSEPGLLFFIQAFALGLSIAGVYRVARALGASDRGALGLAALFLVQPSLHGSAAALNEFGFHPETVFPALFLFAIDAHLRGRRRTFWVLYALSLATVEYYACTWVGVGLVWIARGWRSTDDRKKLVKDGAIAGGVALVWLALAVGVILPRLTNEHRAYYVGQLADQFAARGVGAALGDAALYVLVLGLGLLGLPALSTMTLAVVPLVLVYVQAHLAAYAIPLHVQSWHTGGVLPVLAVAAAEGLVAVEKRAPRARPYLLLAGLVAAWALASIVADAIYVLPAPPLPEERVRELARLEREVPEGAPLAATSYLAAHFGNRSELALFPDIARADWVLVDAEPVRPTGTEEEQRLAERALAELRSDPRFELVSDRAAFLVFRRR